LLEAFEGGLFGVGEAFGVDAEEDGDAVACPFGDLGRGDGGVEPGGQAGVAEVVRTFGERGFVLGWGEDGLAGFVPGAADDGVGGEVAAFGAEQAAVGCGAVFGEVLAEQPAEGRGDRDRADVAGGPVLELALLAAFSGVVARR
jgi:hypothetical protein